MKEKKELLLKVKEEKQALNDLLIQVKLDKEKNKSLIKAKKKDIARLLTKVNAQGGEENAG